MRSSIAAIDRALGIFLTAGGALVLPVSLLLFLQWPLREWVQAYSREANDLAQVLFALYVSFRPYAETSQYGYVSLPHSLTFQNYVNAWTQSDMLRFFGNSVLITIPAVILIPADANPVKVAGHTTGQFSGGLVKGKHFFGSNRG